MFRYLLTLVLSAWPSRGYKPGCGLNERGNWRVSHHSTTSLRYVCASSRPNETEQRGERKIAEFKGKVIVIDDKNLQNQETALESLLRSRCVGFDLEYVPDYYESIYRKSGNRTRPAVVQIANSDTCVVYLVYKIGHLPDCICSFLSNATILKVSHGAPSDMRLLYRHFGVRPRNFVDLQTVSGELKLHPCSLKSVVERVLGLHLNKKQQCSNWEADTLSSEQVKYAATDAWVTLESFLRLKPRSVRKLFVNESGDVEVENSDSF